jgi:hypothetical protein
MNFFKEIQHKSNEWKRKFSLTVSLVIVFIIAVFWFVDSLPKNITEYSKEKGGVTEVVTTVADPLKESGQGIGQAFGQFFAKFKRATTTASTTASTTDLVQ